MSVPVSLHGSATATPIPRVFQPRRTVPSDVVRPTRAEITLANLRHNLQRLQRRTKSPLWCVLKADGYGHGSKACARTLERAGAAGFCVALLEEGIELRNAGVTLPILVMGGYYGSATSELLAHHLTPVLYDARQMAELATEVRYRGAPPASVHLKVDTGMGRLGVMPKELPRYAELLRQTPELQLEGLMTHLACADTDPASVDEQLAKFGEATSALARHGVTPRMRHAANTAALLTNPASHFDLVRPGIGVFGVEPVLGTAPELKPVMRIVSTVVALRELEPGHSVGYGATWRAERRSLIAAVPMGYADGLERAYSNRGEMLIRGKRVKVVGTMSMDLTTLDVTDVPGVSVGDEVTVLGSQQGPLGQDTISATEVANVLGTIPWEILTNISRRVPRFYRGA
jgi:alanine racemase